MAYIGIPIFQGSELTSVSRIRESMREYETPVGGEGRAREDWAEFDLRRKGVGISSPNCQVACRCRKFRVAEAVKESTISRKGAKTQRSTKENWLVCWRSFASWRLCVSCFVLNLIFSQLRKPPYQDPFSLRRPCGAAPADSLPLRGPSFCPLRSQRLLASNFVLDKAYKCLYTCLVLGTGREEPGIRYQVSGIRCQVQGARS
jgi:hypothetical protein